MVLRCFNARPAAVDGAWRFGQPVAHAVRTRADERGGTELPTEPDGRSVRFEPGRGPS